MYSTRKALTTSRSYTPDIKVKSLKVETAHGHALVSGELELLLLLRRRNSRVLVFAAEVVLDDVKRLLVDVHVLV